MSKETKRIFIILTIIFTVILWSILLYFMSPQEIVGKIGIQNSYWVVFLIASFVGVSSFTSTSYYASVVTFAVGGSNPFLLALCAGLGMSIGDSLFYYLGKKGDEVLPPKIDKFTNRIENWLSKRPGWITTTVIYIYTGMTPLPGDLLAIFLGITNFRYKSIIWPIVAGNITLILILGLLAQKGIEVF